MVNAEPEDTQTQPLFDAEVGQEVELNALTDYSTLQELISRGSPWVKIDPRVVSLRDALVHGRLTSPWPKEGLRLVKFEKPKKGESRTRVTYSESVTLEWLREQRQLVNEQIRAIQSAPAAARLKIEFPSSD
jgi:hypothetical protein